MWVGDQRHAPAALTTVQKAVYTPEWLCAGVENLDPRRRDSIPYTV
jgi:hypothetical protein